MPEKPQDLYGSFGSVPTSLPQSNGTPGFSVHANPDDFGANVGSAIEGAGNTAQKLGSGAVDLAIKYQGMVNETLATNAESQYLAQSGQRTGQFRSLTGLEAVNALPQYTKDIQDMRINMRAQLPPGANRAFDLLTVRHEGYALNDANLYSATQIKKAQEDSGVSLVDAKTIAAGDPDVAHNDARFDEHIGDIKYGIQMQMGDTTGPTTGLKVDPDTGAINFDEASPEGRAKKADYQNKIDHYTGLAWENRINTVSNADPSTAEQMYNKWKERIPRDAQVRIESSLEPKMTDARAQGIVGTTLTEAAQSHRDVLLNPPQKFSDIADAIHMQESHGHANSKTSVDGAVGGWQIKPSTFIQYAKPGEDIKNPADNEAVGRRIVADLKQKFQGDPARVAVGYISGPGNVSPSENPIPWLHDYKDSNGKAVSSYVSDVTGMIGSTEKQEQPKKDYATNPEGAPLSLPDYYASHKDEIIESGDKYAERTMPGNLEFKNMVRARLTNQMETAISAQTAQYKQDRAFVQKAIGGELSQGQPPTTYDALRSMPGVAAVLDRVAVHSPEYYKGVDTQIAKMASRNTTENSPNGYETIQRVLETNDSDHPNRIASQDHLDRLLGKSDGTGINMKDYHDGKKALEYSDNWKNFLSKSMRDIAKANGNLDGLGQQRAIEFYNQATRARDEAGDKPDDLINPKSPNYLGNLMTQYAPSRDQQVSAAAKNMRSLAAAQVVKPRQPSETPEAYLQRTGGL